MLSTDANNFGGENVTKISLTQSTKESNLSATPNMIVCFFVLGMTIFILNVCCLEVLTREKNETKALLHANYIFER